MINYTVTTDFEVLSPTMDGSAEVNIYTQMVQNSDLLVDLANRYGIKISFMFEVIQYERFLQIPEYKNDVRKLNDLLLKIHETGHDIQMHGHSEWITAKFSDGRWFRAWNGKDHIHDKMEQFFAIFDQAIDRLKNFLGKEWEPKVFRAGGYQVDPVEPLFEQLLERGIIADTSRHTLDYGSWWMESGLIEIPIYGQFPTKDNRWDLNLGGRSYMKCFEGIPENTETYLPLIMMGHTKMRHDFNALEELFQHLQKDQRFVPDKISTIAEKLKQIPT